MHQSCFQYKLICRVYQDILHVDIAYQDILVVDITTTKVMLKSLRDMQKLAEIILNRCLSNVRCTENATEESLKCFFFFMKSLLLKCSKHFFLKRKFGHKKYYPFNETVSLIHS